MPTYEYRCNACHREFEYQQRMSDPDLVKCEACGADQLEKLISRTAFQLKGGGWYKDLYASTPSSSGSGDKSAPAKSAEAPASPSSSSDSSSSTSSASAGSSSSSPGSGSSSGGSSSSSSAASGS